MVQTQEKFIIVEGKTDREKIVPLIAEPVHIICTHGTIGFEQMEELIDLLENKDVYVLVDADEPGNRLRNQLQQELPNAKQLYIKKMYKEVARTPDEELLRILEGAHIETREYSEILSERLKD